MNYPEYRSFNDRWGVAVLIDELTPEAIEKAVKALLYDHEFYDRLRNNCLAAREIHSWNQEAVKLIDFYKRI